MRHRLLATFGFLAVLAATAPAYAEPVAVRFTEGVTRGFPILRSQSGDVLAQGDLIQVAYQDRVENRLVFRFRDGSVYDESVTYDQRGVFTLLSYKLVQRGPSFPESLDASFERSTGEYRVRYRADQDSKEEELAGKFDLPVDAYNGLLCTVLKNLEPGKSQTVHVMAFTPKPRAIKMLLTPIAQEPVTMGGLAVPATRFHIKPQLGMLASLLVVALPDVKTWIANGEVPAFLRFEGPMFFMGPVWRIDWN